MSDAARWARIRAHFDELVDLDPEQTARRLATLAATDAELAAQVAALLDSDRVAGAVEVVRWVESRAGTGDPLIGRRLGNWTVERPLGEGGMGRVYVARRADRAFDKAVALKVLRAGPGAARLRQRFAQERRIVAVLEHPGIARVLDGGETDEGMPYLVLERVEGVDLVRWAGERALAIDERVRLFVRVLDAVAYAHRRLVVHRDLKPSNILVTSAGEPKLLDFGIAKLLEPDADRPAETSTLERMLTPEYASPEQIRGEPVTTGTDVYSLGVVLYELLVGRTPFRQQATTPGALSRAIEELEPERPSSMVARSELAAERGLAAGIRGDLDAIVLKALRKEPAERYRSVEALADDLGRWLDGRPVAARRGTFAYRAGKFARRRRWAVAASAAILAAFAATVAVYTLRLAAERDRAERRFAETRELARALLFELHDAIRDVDGATAARRLLLERGLAYLERLRAESGGDVELAREVAEGYLRVGEILADRRSLANLGLVEQGRAALDAALALAEPLAEVPGGDQDRARLARVLDALAHQRFDRSLDTARRLALAGRAIDLAEGLPTSGAGAFATLRLRADLAQGRARLLRMSERREEALADLGGALELERAAAALAPADAGAELGVAAALTEVGSALLSLERHAEGLVPLEEARARLEALAAADPASLERRNALAGALIALGGCLAPLGRGAEAVAALERAVGLLEVIVAADAANREAAIRLAVARTGLGRALAESGRYDDAVARFGASLASLDQRAARPDAPSSLAFDGVTFLALLGETARRAAADPRLAEAERGRWRERARGYYEEGVRRFDEAAAVGAPSEHRASERQLLVEALAGLDAS